MEPKTRKKRDLSLREHSRLLFGISLARDQEADGRSKTLDVCFVRLDGAIQGCSRQKRATSAPATFNPPLCSQSRKLSAGSFAFGYVSLA